MWRKQNESKTPVPTPGPIENPTGIATNPVAPFTSFPPAPLQAAPAPAAPAPVLSTRQESSVLSRGIRIRGDLTGREDLYVDGDIDGQIRMGDASVTVGANAHIKADIEARDISMNGQLDGHMRAKERILLGSSSRMKGNVEAPRIVFEDGAKFKGRVEMGRALAERNAQTRETPKKAAAAPAVAAASTTSAPSALVPTPQAAAASAKAGGPEITLALSSKPAETPAPKPNTPAAPLDSAGNSH